MSGIDWPKTWSQERTFSAPSADINAPIASVTGGIGACPKRTVYVELQRACVKTLLEKVA